ncbi:MAG: Fe2+-dependent dioxygenase [Gammaproteobacteria bacterium]|nr:Fe2+-dependent dioxygenase [Gammaproteobacteria bacterium]MDH3371426.1 Fe2+-dependent dioxygenase [Gammaproteobacteria bacterium]MDH3405657.1 Fe2+-dependent dioxygenase [Gammaproteobacteria bacterium]MDH5486765.1 Fe2+-dependent dioxygenase [Gammaproteobacteria bacterium]
MMLHLPSVLESNQLEAVQQLLADAKFVDGKLSAGTAAQRVKHNQELDKRAKQVDILNNLVMSALVQHPVYRAGALPLRVAAPYYARYKPGMAYGDHLDDPIMGADGELYRSDIALTVFLNGPDQYDGGELIIRTAFGDNAVKLAAGDAVMYPASSRHHVNQVTRGERLVAVTWVQSLVRDPMRRELLYELHLAREKLLKISPEAEETAQVNTAYMNLIRMWSDI